MTEVSDQEPTVPTVTREAAGAENASSESLPLSMPQSDEQAAKDIDAVGVEGRPADASSGPGMLLIEMALLGGVILAGSIALGWWVGWVYGVAGLVLGTLALLLNPVMGATAFRVRDRKDAADMERATTVVSHRSGHGVN